MGIRLWGAGALAATITALSVSVPISSPYALVIAPRPATDLNHDGRRDLIVGAPAATVGGFAGAGGVSVVYGTSGGISGTTTPLTQDSIGVPDASEAGDAFGTAIAGGDLNGDGFDDLVVGQPGEDLGTDTDVGAVTLWRGSSAGLASPTLLALPANERVPGDRFGQTLTIGDFNGNGTNDLAVLSVTGYIQPYYDGSPTALAATTAEPAAPRPGERGRYARATASERSNTATTAAVTANITHAAAADINADGRSDLLITYLDIDGLARIVVVPGSAAGLNYDALTTLAGGGRAIAAGDVNGDGKADVVIGQPYEAESGTGATGGAVTIYYGSPAGISAGSKTTITQDTDGVPGGGEAGDGMGLSVAAGDVNKDGYAEVYAGVPDEDITNTAAQADAGHSLLLYGGPGGLSGTGAVGINQDLDQVPGAAEAGDRFGSAVTLADTTGDGFADTAAGVEGENAGDGGITYMIGAATMPPATTGGALSGGGALGMGATSHAGTTLAP